MSYLKAAWQPSPQTIDQLIVWARQAGHIALRYFRSITPHFKPDQSFVTQADLEIEHFLAEQIQRTFPGHCVIGEEGRWGEIDQTQPIWVIDPLDGTTAFAQGLPGWGLSIGLLYQGYPCFGLFYMPLHNDLTYITSQGEVYSNEQNLWGTVQQDWGAKGFLAVGASVHRDFRMDVPRIRAMGSIGANLVYTARGAAAAAFIPRAYLWDLVAGAAILTRAGGELHYLSGQRLNYSELINNPLTPEPIIAGHPKLLVELQRSIRPLRKAERRPHVP